jgi:hypothetical protein
VLDLLCELFVALWREDDVLHTFLLKKKRAAQGAVAGGDVTYRARPTSTPPPGTIFAPCR